MEKSTNSTKSKEDIKFMKTRPGMKEARLKAQAEFVAHLDKYLERGARTSLIDTTRKGVKSIRKWEPFPLGGKAWKAYIAFLPTTHALRLHVEG